MFSHHNNEWSRKSRSPGCIVLLGPENICCFSHTKSQINKTKNQQPLLFLSIFSKKYKLENIFYLLLTLIQIWKSFGLFSSCSTSSSFFFVFSSSEKLPIFNVVWWDLDFCNSTTKSFYGLKLRCFTRKSKSVIIILKVFVWLFCSLGHEVSLIFFSSWRSIFIEKNTIKTPQQHWR